MDYLNKVHYLKSKLDSIRPLKMENELRIMQKFRLDWNYHSNNLEGNSLTYGETKALILFGITAQGKPLKDHFEVAGHDQAIKWVLEIVNQDRPLTENFIRELHTLIIKEPYEIDAITPDGKPTKKTISVGTYKSSPNHVKTKTGEIFRFASPEETPALMFDLIKWYNQKAVEEAYDPILLASEFHYRFIRIHPFDDGNGRTARILMNFILLRFGYPPVIIKTEDKLNYFAALRQADAGLFEPFLNYIAHNLIISLELMLKGANGENIEEDDDINKELALLEKRFSSVGTRIDVSKTEENLSELYDKTITPLITKFIDKGELFEKFYVKTNLKVNLRLISNSNKKEDAISIIREKFKRDINRISLAYHFEGLNQVGFESFSYSIEILVFLNYSNYEISTKNKEISIVKLYGYQLSDDEISELVNLEVKKHKKVIEQKLEEVQKRNNPF